MTWRSQIDQTTNKPFWSAQEFQYIYAFHCPFFCSLPATIFMGSTHILKPKTE